MVATQFSRSERRALRWMRRRGVGLQPSPAAFDVLAARLDVRFRAGLVIGPVFFAFFAWWQFGTTPSRLDDASLWSQVGRTVVLVVAFGLAFVGFTLWCGRADRTIGRTLTARVTRTGAVPARVVLGPVAVWSLALVAALDATVLWLLASRASGADAAEFGVGVVAVGAICAVVLRFALRRPTVALDTSALAVDERLRALDAIYAVWPVAWSSFALLGPLDLRGVEGSTLIVLLAGASLMAGSVLPFSHPAERVRYGFGRFGSRA